MNEDQDRKPPSEGATITMTLSVLQWRVIAVCLYVGRHSVVNGRYLDPDQHELAKHLAVSIAKETGKFGA